MNYDEIYNEEYYAQYTTDRTPEGYGDIAMMEIYHYIITHVLNLLGPSSMLDVGCAYGYGIKLAREEQYNVDAWGADVLSLIHI